MKSEALPTGSFYETLVALERENTGFVLVVLAESLGSTPQDAGAKMLVTADGRHVGTVGGGRIEAAAVELARKMLTEGATAPEFVNWSLKGDVGMTCGGSVKFYLEPHPAGGASWPVVIFGAGHVAQALVPVLQPLPCTILVCDSRPEWLEQVPRARNVRTRFEENPADLVPTLPDQAFVLCMTKGHHSDLPVLRRALLERNFPYLGVIGSASKAAVLRQELIAGGLPAERAARFFCPVGLDFGTNHPHEIALSIAAQLLSERDRIKASKPEGLATEAQRAPSPEA